MIQLAEKIVVMTVFVVLLTYATTLFKIKQSRCDCRDNFQLKFKRLYKNPVVTATFIHSSLFSEVQN